MTVALTTLRTTLATALVDNTKWQTFAFPPATVLANSVIVSLQIVLMLLRAITLATQ
jgi:hypothetical protein